MVLIFIILLSRHVFVIRQPYIESLVVIAMKLNFFGIVVSTNVMQLRELLVQNRRFLRRNSNCYRNFNRSSLLGQCMVLFEFNDTAKMTSNNSKIHFHFYKTLQTSTSSRLRFFSSPTLQSPQKQTSYHLFIS